jgi:hypothetical protein
MHLHLHRLLLLVLLLWSLRLLLCLPISYPYRWRDRPRADSRRGDRQRRRTLSNGAMYRRSQLRGIVRRCKGNPMLHSLPCRGEGMLLGYLLLL